MALKTFDNGSTIGLGTFSMPNVITIMAWVKKITSGTGNVNLVQSSSAYTFRMLNDPRWARTFSTTNGQWDSSSGAPMTAGNPPHHVAVTHDGSSTANNARIFIDGVEVTVNRTTAPVGTANTSAVGWNLFNNSGRTQGWQLLCEDLRIYSRVLSPAEVTKEYEARGVNPNVDSLFRWFKMTEGAQDSLVYAAIDYSPNRSNGGESHGANQMKYDYGTLATGRRRRMA